MEFRLVYEGPLESAANDPRPKLKHAIRRVFHKQLRQIWNTDGGLVALGPEFERQLADNYSRCGYRFVPLAWKAYRLACSLDILFLRREMPGEIVKHGGDIDGRLKTLFDALQIPQSCNQIPLPEEGENPFYCLLEDDHLITGFQVTTDRLLRPPRDGEGVNDVMLVIRVKVMPTMHTVGNSGFLA